MDGRIWFEGNPWPGGHAVRVFMLAGYLDETGIGLILHLEGADCYDEYSTHSPTMKKRMRETKEAGAAGGAGDAGAGGRESGAAPARLFEQEKRTFAMLLGDARRELASRYLSNSTHSVAAIAQMTGYSSPSSFTRWFAAEFGMAPAAWRAEGRQADGGAG